MAGSPKKTRAKLIEEIINNQLNTFIAKHGRAPASDEPVFIDLEGDIPVSFSTGNLRRRLLESALKSGVEPARVLLQFGIHSSEGKA
jgi:hypothetical protein